MRIVFVPNVGLYVGEEGGTLKRLVNGGEKGGIAYGSNWDSATLKGLRCNWNVANVNVTTLDILDAAYTTLNSKYCGGTTT